MKKAGNIHIFLGIIGLIIGLYLSWKGRSLWKKEIVKFFDDILERPKIIEIAGNLLIFISIGGLCFGISLRKISKELEK